MDNFVVYLTMVKRPELKYVAPLEETTLILPDVAPVGTIALILLLESTTKLVALRPLNFTWLAPFRPVPIMVTSEPTEALPGEKEPMPETTVKLVALSPTPAGPTTLILPVVAP